MANPSNKSPLVSVAIASLWRSLMKDIFDTCRPELHYMRGPGPKWHAKYRSQAQDSAMIGTPPSDPTAAASVRVQAGFCGLNKRTCIEVMERLGHCRSPSSPADELPTVWPGQAGHVENHFSASHTRP